MPSEERGTEHFLVGECFYSKALDLSLFVGCEVVFLQHLGAHYTVGCYVTVHPLGSIGASVPAPQPLSLYAH